MKLMPASCAFAMIRFDVASSVGPPNIIVPKQIGDTLRPLRPSWRYCMGRVLAAFSGDSIAVSLRHCERSEAGSARLRELPRPLQNLEHTIGHHHAAAVHADLGA